MTRLLLRAYDAMMTRLNCCGAGVGCGCAIVVILPVSALIGGSAAWALL